MKKISFGSFPLTEVNPRDRKCFDRYLIKTFADNISISDAIRNLSITKGLLYITPDALMKAWMQGKETFKDFGETHSSDRTSNSLYNKALQRAFFILKEYYKKVMNAPFYKEYVYYPIYVEKIDKIEVSGGGRGGQYTEVQLNYSFVIISNDLTKNLKIDEIRYDENASLNFLFLFIEFFAGPEAGMSIHDFGQKDYEFLVKLYQFIEKSGKSPIRVVIDLYKLLGLLKEAASDLNKSSGQNAAFNFKVKKTIDEDLKIKTLKKYRGLLKHEFFKMLASTGPKGGAPVRYQKYQQAFVNLMDIIFTSEGLNGLYDGVEPDADMAARYNYAFSVNKYQEILNLARELVAYNKLGCLDVVTKDQMDIDFKIERGETTIDIKIQNISKQFQTFFKTFVESIRNKVENDVEAIINTISIADRIKRNIETDVNKIDSEITSKQSQLSRELAKKSFFEKEAENHKTLADTATAAGNASAQAFHIGEMRKFGAQMNAQDVIINRLRTEIEILKNMKSLLNNLPTQAEKILGDRTRRKKIVDKIVKVLISTSANSLTFIYDDSKRYFSDRLIAQGFADLTSGVTTPSYDITDSTDFKNVARNPSVFPEKHNGEFNPIRIAADVTASIFSTITTMSSDIAEEISASLTPLIAEIFAETHVELLSKEFEKYERQSSSTMNGFFASITGKNNTDYLEDIIKRAINGAKRSAKIKLPNDYEETLRDEILSRYITYVVKNLKKILETKHIESVVQFNDEISQLHPLIRKLLDKKDKKGRNCQYFKSYIIHLNTILQLYNLKFITDTKKFIYGITNNPPRKLSTPLHKMQEVLYKYLGLEENPVWIISQKEIFLSMPDDYSLTRTSILSRIDKKDLMNVCKIRPRDFWNERTMSKITNLGSKELVRLYKKLEKINNDIEHEEELRRKASGKDRKKHENEIKRLRAKADRIEEEIAKERQKMKEKGDPLPNAFVFNDDPNYAENEPLLTDTEKAEIERKEEEMNKALLRLNPYSDDEFEEMKERADKFDKHPFDFEEREEKSAEEMNRISDEELRQKFEEFLKQRENFYQKQSSN